MAAPASPAAPAPACRSCWAGALKVFRRGLPASSAVPEDVEERRQDSSLFVQEDEALLRCRIEEALPHMLKFNPGSKFDGVTAVGLRYLCSQLMMDISEVDLDRLFLESDADGDGLLGAEELISASRSCGFFRNLVGVILAAADFKVGREYNCFRSTRQNYAKQQETETEGGADQAAGTKVLAWDCDAAAAGAAEAAGSCQAPQRQGGNAGAQQARAVARVAAGESAGAQCDKTSFRDDRARWQREVLLRSLRLPASPSGGAARPWCIFTLALPGAMPREVLNWISSRGMLPLSQLVEVSADVFVQRFPELPLYIRKQGDYAQGAAFVREEAELLEAEAVEVATSAGHHVWVSSEPNDAQRVRVAVEGLRRRHPEYRIAVLDIRADAPALQRRQRLVARQHGRAMPAPADPATPSEEQLRALAARADLLARVESSEDIPVLLRIETADDAGCWPAFGRCFAEGTREEVARTALSNAAEFPYSLRPLRFIRKHANDDVLSGKLENQSHLDIDILRYGSAMGCALSARRLATARSELAERPLELLLSTVGSELPGGNEEGPLVEPDENAVRFAWLHGLKSSGHAPLSNAWLQEQGIDSESLLVSTLRHGCLVHLDKKGQAVTMDVPTDRPSENFLQFGPPKTLSARAAKELSGRWQPVSEERLSGRGAEEECWIAPGEVLAGRRLAPAGAFAYKLSAQAAMETGISTVYFEVLR